MIAWGKLVGKPGIVNDHTWAFWDMSATLADVAGAKVPAGLDGVSAAPSITGRGDQKRHDFLYWEFHEKGFKQAVRHGDWKAIRSAPGQPLALYDVAKDPMEMTDVAKDHRTVIAVIEGYLKTARTDSQEFPIREK
jgi:arylsulfatase A-like enzyme